MRIKEMAPGQIAKITAFTSGAAEYRQRLLMLGLVPGTQFELQRLGPLGGPGGNQSARKSCESSQGGG